MDPVVLALSVVTFILGIIFMNYVNRKRIESAVARLRENLTNEELLRFIQAVQRLSISRRSKVVDVLADTYRLVNKSPDINKDLKQILRTVLIKKGITVKNKQKQIEFIKEL
ncbi:MAG: hypothetical protein ACOYBM_02700 [Dethiobacteria bacterium]|jgi:hypothetical protein